MSATTEACYLFSYKPSKTNETTNTGALSEIATQGADILFLPATRLRTAESPLSDEAQFHGPSYLLHHWCLSFEELWSWKNTFLIVILMAALAKYIHWCYPVPCWLWSEFFDWWCQLWDGSSTHVSRLPHLALHLCITDVIGRGSKVSLINFWEFCSPNCWVWVMRKILIGLFRTIVKVFSRCLLVVAFLYLVLISSVFLYSWYTHDGSPITGWGWNQVLRNWCPLHNG